MLWNNRRASTHVDDRRGVSGGRLAAGGGVVGVIGFIIMMLLGVDPTGLLQSPTENRPRTAEDDQMAKFVAVVLADTEDVWHALFKQSGQVYREPTLVLFSGQVQSACGRASASVGPFYCPLDEQVYIDLAFFNELAARLGARGDFAVAYVLAHEVGHHVQRLTGSSKRVDSQRGRVSETEQNRLSVRLELQADYLAGVWAHHAQKMKNILEAGDIEEAMGAAEAVGDDRLQKAAKGYVVPDSFTHGTSAQRARWFKLGLQTGDFKGAEQLFALPYEGL
jgi:predicted metalloprotease